MLRETDFRTTEKKHFNIHLIRNRNIDLITHIMTHEQQVYNVLSQQPFSVILGGREILLRPATLNDIQKMSEKVSLLPVIEELDEGDPNEVSQFVENGKYVKTIAHIISITAHPKSNLPTKIFRRLHVWWQRRKIFNLAYKEANSLEIYFALQSVLKAAHPFFFQNIIISLKGMNNLKPTKEISQIAHGQ